MRHHVYRTLASANAAYQRALKRGETPAAVLVQITPVGLIGGTEAAS